MVKRSGVLWREVAMTLGLFPFAFTGAPFVAGAWIGWVVVLNGAATHLTSAFGWRHCDYLRIVDTATNVALCFWINVSTHWQPYSLFVTLFVAIAWVLNTPRDLNASGKKTACTGILKQWVSTTFTAAREANFAHRKQAHSTAAHVVLVQWALCFVLYVREHNVTPF